MSGNGADNAHNNQFGGGGRGPTGGVNTGDGGSKGSGHEHEFGYWDSSKSKKGYLTYDANGQPRIHIIDGPKWVHDDPMHGPGSEGNGDGNLKTNKTVKTNTGYQAVINGFVYTVTVNGKDQITSVNLFSRPAIASKKSWAQSETTYKTQARALVQVQLDNIISTKIAAEKKSCSCCSCCGS